MSRGAWLAVFAAGWLILGSALGQAQEEAQNARGDADQQQEPASYPPLPLPVEIVEDESTTQSRERREAETRKREIDDLIAQQGMNAATQRMTLATEDMRDYAYAQTWLIGIGTGLLLITLWLTRQANAAAQEAVKVARDIGSTQLRAWVAFYEWDCDNKFSLTEMKIGNLEKSDIFTPIVHSSMT